MVRSLLVLLFCLSCGPTPINTDKLPPIPPKEGWSAQAIRWETTPLKVFVSPDLGLKYLVAAYRASERWNLELSCRVFTVIHQAKEANVFVLPENLKKAYVALVSISKAHGKNVAYIRYTVNTYSYVEAFVLAHEFGHVLGLYHAKDNTDNIMTPYADNFSIRSRISDSAKRVLRAMYCYK